MGKRPRWALAAVDAHVPEHAGQPRADSGRAYPALTRPLLDSSSASTVRAQPKQAARARTVLNPSAGETYTATTVPVPKARAATLHATFTVAAASRPSASTEQPARSDIPHMRNVARAGAAAAWARAPTEERRTQMLVGGRGVTDFDDNPTPCHSKTQAPAMALCFCWDSPEARLHFHIPAGHVQAREFTDSVFPVL